MLFWYLPAPNPGILKLLLDDQTINNLTQNIGLVSTHQHGVKNHILVSAFNCDWTNPHTQTRKKNSLAPPVLQFIQYKQS